MFGNVPLRMLLDSIVSEENAENWWQPKLFKKNTRHRLPKNLIVREEPPRQADNYNCFVFAFDLQNHAPILGMDGWEYTRSLDKIIDSLIANRILKKLGTAENNSLVVYRTNTNIISHVGRMTSKGVVTSKWSWGPVIEHALYDVPASYGDTIEYYTNLTRGREALLEHFSQYQSGKS